MADLVITAANVHANDERGTTERLLTGEALTEGQVVYFDSSIDPAELRLADNTTSSETAKARGIVITPADDAGFATIQKTGSIKPGATLVKGQLYYLTSTPGGLSLFADLSGGEIVAPIFRATSTTEADMDLKITGITL